MKLSVRDRLLISHLIPAKGRLIEMQVVSNIKQKVSFSSEEITGCNIRDTEEGTVLFSQDIEKDFDFTISELEVLSKGVQRLDEAGEVTEQLLSLCERFK